MESSSIALTWFLLALIAAGIAQGMNRDGFTWFLVTAVLGPIGLFLLVISGKAPCKCEVCQRHHGGEE